MTTINLIENSFKNEDILDFKEIFKVLENEFRPSWELEASKKEISYEDLLTKKRGEIYKLLTIHGDFVKLKDNKWTTYKAKIENSL